MTTDRWSEIERVFLAALELPAEERSAFVERECAGDEELRAQVLRMLRVGEPEPRFLLPPPPGAETVLPPDVAERQLGDFELLEEIGRGGMGVVFKAWQRSLGRRVAVKVLPKSFTLTARQIERFLREARAAAKLQHPGIVPVLTVGESDGSYYFAMELVEGHDLAFELTRLREAAKKPGVSPTTLPSSADEGYFRAVARIVRDAADALSFAHEHGIVHRDVKPSNLLIDPEQHVKIVDFGLARDESQGTITRTGDMAGTPHYMSPEQARGRIHQVDARTDVYSLGVVLFELLTLQRPFEGKTSHEILHKILQVEPPRVRKLNGRVPRDLETICLTAMAKEPKDRYASAGALRDDLDRLLAHQAIEARPPALGERCARLVRRHRVLLLLGVIVVVSAASAIVVTLRQVERRRVDRLLDEVSRLTTEGPLERLPLLSAIELRRLVRELREVPGIRAADSIDPVSQVERDFETLRLALREQGQKDLDLGSDPKLPDGTREMHRLAGMLTLLRASYIFPDDLDLADRARMESAFPTLTIRSVDAAGEETPASVFLRSIDPMSDAVLEKHSIGRTPLAGVPIPGGYYRVVVVFDLGGFRELVCSPGPANMRTELIARRRPDEDLVTKDMIAIPACAMSIHEPVKTKVYGEQTVALEAFSIDATEVSNSEYALFLRETGRGAPRLWTYVDDMPRFLREYGDRPVTCVMWNDAVAFAEWMGKRLPTAHEWNRAAGGPENWPTPYSPDAAAPPRGNVFAPYVTPVGELAAWQRYLERSAPVRSSPDARTPEGLFHMFGNVYELTESMPITEVDERGSLAMRPFDRLYYGGAWDAVEAKVPMYAPNYWALGPDYIEERLGFRCAKSAAP